MRKLIILFFVSLLIAAPCFAEISGIDPNVKSDLVKAGSDVIVPEGATVKSAVAFGGNVIVGGTVMESAVAIGGDVKLEKTARILKDVVSIGGKVEKDPGAVVLGNVTEIGMGGVAALPTAVKAQGLIWAGAFFALLSFIAILALALFIAALFPGYLGRVSYYSERLPGKAFLWGLLTAILIIPIIVLLAISIIGIIFIPVYLMLLIAGAFFGYMAVSQLIGKKILKALRVYNKPMFIEITVGLLILALIDLIPIVGWLVKCIVGLIGLGAVYATRFGIRD